MTRRVAEASGSEHRTRGAKRGTRVILSVMLLGAIFAAAEFTSGVLAAPGSSGVLGGTACEGGSATSPSPSPTDSLLPPLPTLNPDDPLGTASPDPSATPSSEPSTEPTEPSGRTCGTEITLAFKKKGFSGTVSSDEQGCLSGRNVKLLQDRKGKKDLKAGAAVTDDGGEYLIPAKKAEVQGNKYYATASKATLADEQSTTCSPAKSNTVKP